MWRWGHWVLAGLMAVGLAQAAAGTPAQALLDQAATADNQGDTQTAIALYGQAIAAGAEFEGRLGRSVAYADSGDFTDGFADLDRAQALQPGSSLPVSLRYWFLFQLDQFAQVAAVSARVERMQPVDAYAPLVHFIALARLGQDGRADLERAYPPSSRNQWPQALAQMFLGQVSPAQLLQWVALSGNAQASCEAPFYVGEYELIHQARTEAQAAFDANQQDQCRPFTEYFAARAEAAALQGPAQ